MKLSLVFSVLASIVVLASAYPTQGDITKRSGVEKREELDVNDVSYSKYKELLQVQGGEARGTRRQRRQLLQVL
ncbi:hypothetical protein BDR05DRAFT_959526, partial [Suillus weaverae]